MALTMAEFVAYPESGSRNDHSIEWSLGGTY